MGTPDGTDLMLRYEVAALFEVDPRTVSAWGASGKLHPLMTPGGRRRYFAGEVRALLAGKPLTPRQLGELREQALRKAVQP